jgi:hypothetical protein
MTQLLANLAVTGSALVVTKGTVREVVQAANNVQKIWTLPVEQLNALELLSKDLVIMTVEAARWVEEALASEPHGRRGLKANGGITKTDSLAATEAADVEPEVEETTEEEETPKPRRRRASGAKPESEVTEIAEETPKPRTRRRRNAASSAEDVAPASESTDTETQEEGA